MRECIRLQRQSYNLLYTRPAYKFHIVIRNIPDKKIDSISGEPWLLVFPGTDAEVGRRCLRALHQGS